MKQIRTAGLAAVTALILAAFVGTAPAPAAQFEAAEYPAYISGKDVGGPFGGLIVRTFGRELSCSEVKLSATLDEASASLTSSAVTAYGCGSSSGPYPVDFKDCQFSFEPVGQEQEGAFGGAVGMGPPECGPVKVGPVFTPTDYFEIDRDAGYESEAEYTNVGENWPEPSTVLADTIISGLHSIYTGNGGESTATFLVNWELSAMNENEEAIGLQVAE